MLTFCLPRDTTVTTPYQLKQRDVIRRFELAAASFDAHDFVHRHTADGLLARLEGLRAEARLVVDLGCATGAALRPLAKRFRGARVVGVDLTPAMVARAVRRGGWLSKISAICADARALPFDDDSVDVVFANQLLPWFDEPASVLREVARVLRDGGLFLFASLGPDSLAEIERAFGDDRGHVHRFPDMHDVGDALLRAGLRDPVLDVDRLEISYQRPEDLFRDLTAAGGRNCLAGRQPGLTSRRRFEAMRERLTAAAGDGGLRMQLELVYGHAWGAAAAKASGVVHIDPAAIPLRRRRN